MPPSEPLLRAHELVGKRIRVKWAQNRHFAGVVESYDASTEHHTVHYDDGDVRVYQLKGE